MQLVANFVAAVASAMGAARAAAAPAA